MDAFKSRLKAYKKKNKKTEKERVKFFFDLAKAAALPTAISIS